MGNRRGTRAAFRIKENTKYTDTTPELALDTICKELGLVLVKGEEIQVPGFTIRPDRKIVNTNVLLEALGTYHQTKIQQRKTDWRTDILIQAGYRVLLIESELLVTHNLGDAHRFWPYVSDEITKFLKSTEASKYLSA